MLTIRCSEINREINVALSALTVDRQKVNLYYSHIAVPNMDIEGPLPIDGVHYIYADIFQKCYTYCKFSFSLMVCISHSLQWDYY